MDPADGRRIIIEGLVPQIDNGAFDIKRTVGERVEVEADVFTDGHDVVTALLLVRAEGAQSWTELPMEELPNDRFRAEFQVTTLGRWVYTVGGWVDPFRSWRRDLAKRVAAGQDPAEELLVGGALVRAAGERAREAGKRADGRVLVGLAKALEQGDDVETRTRLALDVELAQLMARYTDRREETRHEPELGVRVDRERARFGSWYEMFPRSAAKVAGQHGTFKDCEALLPYVAGMGFDVLYLPPVHPIGRTKRKGKNNAVTAAPDDVGSPWAIGGAEGGHKSIHPQLGTAEDFRRFVAAAKGHGLEIAMDIAFQCSPDHPYVSEHPEWFRHRPDGTIKYAENPPKKYQDIYPID